VRRCLKIISVAVVVVLAAIAGLWLAHRPLLRGAAHLWVVSGPVAHADAIVVLGGGLEVRPIAAADLYKRGVADKILISNVKLGPAEKLGLLPSHTDQNRDVLLKLGVPADSIVVFGKDITNTFEEADALAKWAKSTGAKGVIVPTEYFPSRRVRWVLLQELAPAGVTVSVIAFPPPEYDFDNWWHTDIGVVEFQNEVLKYIYYRLRY
jgi:uncharacterized SAM-binding protein YcdF (DUF218 family)